MTSHQVGLLLALATLLPLAMAEPQGLPEGATPATTAMARWYTPAQVRRGGPLYQTHCAGCHRADASGTTRWKRRDANGHLPPPPLNGTAHTWHHPLGVLRRTLRIGGVPLGGTMPGFARHLDLPQIDAIIAWIQSHWDDRIYRIWEQRDRQSRSPRGRAPGG